MRWPMAEQGSSIAVAHCRHRQVQDVVSSQLYSLFLELFDLLLGKVFNGRALA